MLKVSCDEKYANLSPNKIVPALADEGLYIASESTFHRILKDEQLLKHRDSTKPVRHHQKPQPLIASTPNEIYSWDITYLPTSIRGLFFYLYLVMDIYSRKIVGWQVYETESSALAADLMTDICAREKIMRHQVTLHSDNGSPMKGATMLATLQELGVMPTFSRPSVSNDNPYVESLFKTVKYCPQWPKSGFATVDCAREWMLEFTRFYNHEHRHSGIRFVTPAQRHQQQDAALLEKRKAVYEQAKSDYPQRWAGRATRNWSPIGPVSLNPEREIVPTQAAA